MEDIYPPESFGSSAHFPLKTYFEKFNNIFSSELAIEQVDGELLETDYLLEIKELMGEELSFNDIKHLSKTCSIDHLTCEGENTKDFPMEVPQNINSNSKLPYPLITTDNQDLMLNKFLSELGTDKNLCLSSRRNFHKNLEIERPLTLPDLELGSEFIVSVLVYKPFAFRYFNSKNASEKLRFNHEIVTLGRNTLAELRDTIVCSADFGLCQEVENTSNDLRALADARTIYPSGFMFIDDVFYNDLRDPAAVDYSAPIMKWAKEKKITGLSSTSMENVTISSLTPRLGYPYLYMHQGDCEHLIVFAEAKLLDQSSCLHSKCYPYVIKLNRYTNKMCFMCSVTFAKWICVGSDRLPQHKVFLCTDCCNAYNYIDGKKIGNFKLYPYYEKHVI